MVWLPGWEWEKWEILVKGYRLLRWINSGDLMYSMVSVVNNTVLYTWKLLRVDLKCSHNTKSGNYVRFMLITSIVAIISVRLCISNHHIVHFKYVQFLFVSYTLIKLEKENKYGNRVHYFLPKEWGRTLLLVVVMEVGSILGNLILLSCVMCITDLD